LSRRRQRLPAVGQGRGDQSGGIRRVAVRLVLRFQCHSPNVKI
jgi:hypothetical protein